MCLALSRSCSGCSSLALIKPRRTVPHNRSCRPGLATKQKLSATSFRTKARAATFAVPRPATVFGQSNTIFPTASATKEANLSCFGTSQYKTPIRGIKTQYDDDDSYQYHLL